MKQLILLLALITSVSCASQETLDNGFVPFKLEICGETFYNAKPNMIGVMKSHIGESVPEIDMNGDGLITVVDVIILLTHQQDWFWSPSPACTDNFVHDWQDCGCMPNPSSCGSSSYCVSFMDWTQDGVIGYLSTSTYGANNFTWTYAK